MAVCEPYHYCGEHVGGEEENDDGGGLPEGGVPYLLREREDDGGLQVEEDWDLCIRL